MNPTEQTGQVKRRRIPGKLKLAASVVFVVWVGVMSWNMLHEANAFRDPPPGDGVHVESYGFDLSNLAVDRKLVVPTSYAKDVIKSLPLADSDTPLAVSVDEMHEINSRLRQMHKGKYIVDSDRVIGVEIDGQARAYPIRFMMWHQVINDTLGGKPIAVTYHGWCDSVVVFDRTVGGQALDFGVSGLLYNSNQLLYDRREKNSEESLWSQLSFKPIAGPAVEKKWELQPLAMTVTTWGQWLADHPDTTILRGVDEYFEQKYKQHPFAYYWENKQVIFPVAREVPAESKPEPFDRVMVFIAADGRTVTLRVSPYTGQIAPDQPAEWVEKLKDRPALLQSMWFAFYTFNENGRWPIAENPLP